MATVHVKSTGGVKVTLSDVDLSLSVKDFKDQVAASELGIPAAQQRLIYKGQVLKDERTLSSYGLESDHTVHCVKGAAPAGAGSPSTNTTTSNPTPAAAAARTNSTSPSTHSLFDSFGAMPSMQEMQQQMMQDPNTFREMMNSPILQNLLNNPELMRQMVMSNPQLQELMDRNPELSHLLNDPAVLRQAMETARNPELMREQMATTDRAMANIESHPEGFNALRRMYETMQEPLLNGPRETAVETGPGRTAPPAPEGTPNNAPLPNPWAPAGATGPANTAGARTRTAPTGAANTTAPAANSLHALLGSDMGALNDSMGMNPELMRQMMNSPGVQEHMQRMLQNPQLLQSMMEANPQMRAMLDSNPELRTALQNPQMLQAMANPDTMQAMMQIQQGMQQLQSTMPGMFGEGGALGAGLGGGPPGLGVPPPSQPSQPPEQLYATQLQQLQEMGFFDSEANVRALQMTGGNVHAAVERLLAG